MHWTSFIYDILFDGETVVNHDWEMPKRWSISIFSRHIFYSCDIMCHWSFCYHLLHLAMHLFFNDAQCIILFFLTLCKELGIWRRLLGVHLVGTIKFDLFLGVCLAWCLNLQDSATFLARSSCLTTSKKLAKIETPLKSKFQWM